MADATDTEATFAADSIGCYWGWPFRARKAHLYRKDGPAIDSLCGGRVLFGEVPPLATQTIGPEPGPDDCIRCHRKALKEAGRA